MFLCDNYLSFLRIYLLSAGRCFLLIKSSGLKLNVLGFFCNLIIYVFMKVNDILIMLKKDGWSLVATRGSHRHKSILSKMGV